MDGWMEREFVRTATRRMRSRSEAVPLRLASRAGRGREQKQRATPSLVQQDGWSPHATVSLFLTHRQRPDRRPQRPFQGCHLKGGQVNVDAGLEVGVEGDGALWRMEREKFVFFCFFRQRLFYSPSRPPHALLLSFVSHLEQCGCRVRRQLHGFQDGPGWRGEVGEESGSVNASKKTQRRGGLRVLSLSLSPALNNSRVKSVKAVRHIFVHLVRTERERGRERREKGGREETTTTGRHMRAPDRGGARALSAPPPRPALSLTPPSPGRRLR